MCYVVYRSKAIAIATGDKKKIKKPCLYYNKRKWSCRSLHNSIV